MDSKIGTHNRGMLALIMFLNIACSGGQRILDPDPLWMPDSSSSSILDKIRGSAVRVKNPPFHELACRLQGVGSSFVSADDPGCCAYFAIDKAPQDFAFLVLHPRSIGDIGDIYYRVTGQRDPRLAGDLTEFYKQSIRDMIEYSALVVKERQK